MADKEIPPQSHYLYNEEWNDRLDNFFLQFLLVCKKRDQWRGLKIPSYVLEETRRKLNSMYKLDLTMATICSRAQFMQKRYLAFKSVVPPQAQTHWDSNANTITAHYKVWRKLFKSNKFTMAYYWSGDPEFKNLMALFGMDEEIKHEGGNAVIVISDTTDMKHESDAVDECADEVNSPNNGIVSARRRLFSEAPHVSDAGSTIMAPEGTFPGPGAFPFRYMPDSQSSVAGDEGSYCASSCPYSPITGYLKKP